MKHHLKQYETPLKFFYLNFLFQKNNNKFLLFLVVVLLYILYMLIGTGLAPYFSKARQETGSIKTHIKQYKNTYKTV